MSLEITVYTKNLSDELIPEIQKRLNKFEMECEFHPEFSFKDQSGFLPFKFQLKNPPFDILKNRILLSGFELFVRELDFQEEKRRRNARKGLITKLIGLAIPDKTLVNHEIDQRIKECSNVVSFVWHSVDSFEFRLASLTSAILTELTNGICTYLPGDIWYDTNGLVESTWNEIRKYESELLKESDLKFHVFETW